MKVSHIQSEKKMLEFVENLSDYDGLGTEGLIQNKVSQTWAYIEFKVSFSWAIENFGLILSQFWIR